MGDWFKTRINNIDIFDEHHQLEAKTNPFYALGPIFYLVWFIVMFTGLVLIMWYVPTKSAAFDSILNIQNGIPIGGLFRGMHKYGADAMIIAATMRLYRMFIMADFKPNKEFNIIIALITLLLSMYSGLTGYLLIWNQRAFWATKVFTPSPLIWTSSPSWAISTCLCIIRCIWAGTQPKCSWAAVRLSPRTQLPGSSPCTWRSP